MAVRHGYGKLFQTLRRNGVRSFSTSNSHSDSSQKIGASSIILLLPPAITFFLGSWQIQRREGKINLLNLRSKRLSEDPIPLAEVLQGDGPDSSSSLEYRKVVCRGTFDNEKSIFLGPRARSVYGVNEKGYYVISPLIPQENGCETPVLVNRGWIPSSWREDNALLQQKLASQINDVVRPTPAVSSSKSDVRSSEKRSWLSKIFVWDSTTVEKETVEKKLETSSIVEVSGVVRFSEIPSSFVPPNNPEIGQWFFVDVAQIAHSVGLPETTILIDLVKTEDNSFDEDYPTPKDPGDLLRSKVMPIDHLTYAATWFTLSAATTFLAYKRLTMPVNSKFRNYR